MNQSKLHSESPRSRAGSFVRRSGRRLKAWLGDRPVRAIASDEPATPTMRPYQIAYDRHAARILTDEVIGGGDFETVGSLELSALQQAGLAEASTLLDLGCGVGRLATHAVPYLARGTYYGVEISADILARARQRLEAAEIQPSAHVRWVLSADPLLPEIPDRSIDICCAFSVFTHIEHEDTLVYLRSLRQKVREGGSLVFSHLLLEENPVAAEVLNHSASLPYAIRYREVRNVVSSRPLLDRIAQIAGWTVERWVAHDEPCFTDHRGVSMGMGQAVCYLK